MLIPLSLAAGLQEVLALKAFMLAFVITLTCGIALSVIYRQGREQGITVRDGFLLVTLSWLLISILGAIPYIIAGSVTSFVDAVFESTSGFTTTGATLLADIEILPRSILLWRSMSQWIGGLGIIVLAVAILPQLSVGGMQLMKNEMPGPTFEQLKPRIKQTALSLWKIYALFSALLVVVLYLAGMPLFESICHMLTTVSTGGFSTQNASIAAYSPTIQFIIIIFMFLGGVNFVLHYAWLHGNPKKLLMDVEWRSFTSLIVLAIVLVMGDLIFHSQLPVVESLRLSAFQVVSLGTSSGFTTTDYNVWPNFSKGILFLLMFVGGCAGSTAGGFKQIRMYLLILKAKSTLIKQIFPKAVTSIKIGKRAVSDDVLDGVSNLFLVSVVIFAMITLVLLVFNIDLVTATSAVIACLSNIGPAFEMVGPAVDYAWLPDPIKLLLSACMIVGRLEFFTVLVLFLPVAWKR